MSQIAYLITSDQIGTQDAPLGQLLMRTLLTKLIVADQKPSHLLFLEKGVQLLLPDCPAIDALKILNDTGVELLACKTCTDNYDITEKIVAGKISNMGDIISVMHDADKVISL